MDEYISREAAVDAGYLSDWYISSVGDESPVWTDEHIDELLNDYIVIPKDIPSADVQPMKQDTELSIILQDYGIKDTDTLRYILDQYQKIIVDITGGQMSYLTYPAEAVLECVNDYYLSALAEKFCPICGAKLTKDGDSK